MIATALSTTISDLLSLPDPPLSEALAALAVGLPPGDIQELAIFADFLRHRARIKAETESK